MAKTKGFNFYMEVVLTTILSILAAGLWRDFITKLLPENNLYILGTVCIIVTAASIFLLEYLFSNVGSLKN